jgi:hypothetical protein
VAKYRGYLASSNDFKGQAQLYRLCAFFIYVTRFSVLDFDKILSIGGGRAATRFQYFGLPEEYDHNKEKMAKGYGRRFQTQGAESC